MVSFAAGVRVRVDALPALVDRDQVSPLAERVAQAYGHELWGRRIGQVVHDEYVRRPVAGDLDEWFDRLGWPERTGPDVARQSAPAIG
jgi:hypothetical protein